MFHVAIALFLVYLGLLYETRRANNYLLVLAVMSAITGWALRVAL